jgi:quercetin dioxygenase-like cupin family protein
VQVEGGAREEVLPGDIVGFAPGEKHWHGATVTTAMSHMLMPIPYNAVIHTIGAYLNRTTL